MKKVTDEEVLKAAEEIKKELPPEWNLVGFAVNDSKEGVLTVERGGFQGQVYLEWWMMGSRRQEIRRKIEVLERARPMTLEEASERIRGLEERVQELENRLNRI